MHPLLFCDAVYVLRETERIDAVNHFKQWQCVPDFVLLKMSYEMPAQIRGQLGNFRSGFLNTTFTEETLPGFNRLAHFLSRMRFGDRNQFNVISRSARFRRRACDLLANALETFGDRTHVEL
jgi:hypothetical protein